MAAEATPAPLAVPPPHPRRLAYLGTPPLAVGPLRALVAAGYDVALVVSAADKRRGRGGALAPSPVKAAAVELGLAVTDRVDDVVTAGVDLGVVVAFGRIIRRPVLEAVPMVNLHFSRLPRWRGAAPVERAILAGDPDTAVCLMQVEEGLDTGAVYGCEGVAIGPDDDLEGLRSELVERGTGLLLRHLADGLGTPRPQAGEATYAAKLEPADRTLDFTRPADEVHRVVRLGGATTTFRGEPFKVVAAHPAALDGEGGPGAPLDAATATALATAPVGTVSGDAVRCGRGALVLDVVQQAGRSRQEARAWRNGARLVPGEVLGT